MPNFREIVPDKRLGSVVKNFWVLEYKENSLVRNHLLPSTLCYLFYIRTSREFKAHYVQSNKIFTISNGFHLSSLNTLVEFEHQEFLAIGASIYPIYTSLLFKENPSELVNMVKKDFDKPRLSSDLLSPQDMVREIEQQLLSRLSRNPILDRVSKIYQQMVDEKLYSSSVKEVAGWIGYSTRHLSNLFRQYLGMSPKRFFNLMRFNHALELLERFGVNDNLSEVAYELGYHDQSHFIKDFKAACGKTPKEMLADSEPDVMAKFFTLY